MPCDLKRLMNDYFNCCYYQKVKHVYTTTKNEILKVIKTEIGSHIIDLKTLKYNINMVINKKSRIFKLEMHNYISSSRT